MRWLVGPMIVLLPHVGMTAQLSGFYKSFSVAFDSPHAGVPVRGMVSNRLRINLANSFSEYMSFDLAYDFILRIQNENRAEVLTIDPHDYRVADLRSPIYPGDNEFSSVGVFQNFDRASVTTRLPFADVIVGRQAIAWGSARVVNPTDVIAPFIYSELDTEDRPGVDAVRVRLPIGALSEVDVGYVFGRDFAVDQSAFFARSQFNVAETDVSPLFVHFREQLLVGIDVARGIGSVGAWIEGTRVFTMGRDAAISDYFRISTGADYSFGETYGFIEYHFNGAGVRDPEDYLVNLNRSIYRDAAVYLMGAHYFALGATHQFTPLVALSGQFLANVTDPSFFFAPAIEYNIEQDFYLSAGAFIGIGDRPQGEYFQSEFGGYSNILFLSFRIYY